MKIIITSWGRAVPSSNLLASFGFVDSQISVYSISGIAANTILFNRKFLFLIKLFLAFH